MNRLVRIHRSADKTPSLDVVVHGCPERADRTLGRGDEVHPLDVQDVVGSAGAGSAALAPIGSHVIATLPGTGVPDGAAASGMTGVAQLVMVLGTPGAVRALDVRRSNHDRDAPPGHCAQCRCP